MSTKRFFRSPARRVAAALTACLFLLPLAAESKKPALTDEELDYAQMVAGIAAVRSPYLQGDCVIFTADSSARYVGIAFDFEDFSTIHQFKKRSLRDIEYTVTDSLYFYILKLPKNVQSISYRLIIDGLWTTDPTNANKAYVPEAGAVLSQVNVSRTVPLVTEKLDDGTVRFVYRGKGGQKVRLGGSFTNWDSWIYEMQEIAPGLYELDLPLPPGTYDYAYYTGISSTIDTTNPTRCYTEDGREASRITVD